MDEEGLVASGCRLEPRRDVVGLVAIDDGLGVELDEEVEIGEEGAGSNLSDLHGGEVALDGTWEGPSHGSAEIVGVHAGVNKAVEDTEDCIDESKRWRLVSDC